MATDSENEELGKTALVESEVNNSENHGSGISDTQLTDKNKSKNSAAIKKSKPLAPKIIRICGLVLLCAILLLLTVNSLLNVFVKHYYPTYGKYRLFAIVSNSMEGDAEDAIPTGSIIVDRIPKIADEIKVGTIITYEYRQENNSIVLITHRVTAIHTDSETGVISYTTKGDNVERADSVRPTFDDVVGVYTGNKCGFIGYVVGFLQSTEGAVTLIIILLIVVATIIIVHFINLVNIWRNVALNALKKSASILNSIDNIEELGTLADVIGIATKDPEGQSDIKRKDEKLNWFIEMSALPKRPYPDDLEEYLRLMGDSLKPVPVPKLKYADETDTKIIIKEVLVSNPAEQKSNEINDEKQAVEGDFEKLLTTEQILCEAETEPEDEAAEFEVLPEEDEPQEVVRSVDKLTGMAIIVRYKKSFTAKYIQSDDKVKSYYTMLKNELLSYKKVRNRISWNHENFNFGRNNIARISIRGKTLCFYFALDANDYVDTKYKVEYAESKKYENISCMYRIKNARRAKYALELISDLAKKFGLERGEEQRINYYLPYEPIQPLVDRELIKELVSEEFYNEFMRTYSRKEVDRKRREFVSANEVNEVITDDVAVALVEDKRDATLKSKTTGKKGIINVDTLSDNYDKFETVNLVSLKEKGLIAKNIVSLKILARGTLTKPLTVEAQDFSIEAIKMIVLTGGKAYKI